MNKGGTGYVCRKSDAKLNPVSSKLLKERSRGFMRGKWLSLRTQNRQMESKGIPCLCPRHIA